MNHIRFWTTLFAATLFCVAPAAAQIEAGRAAALDYLGRGTAAFRAGDIIAATRHWSEAIRLCRLNGARDLEAQALARRGEARLIEWRAISATPAAICRRR
jgi:Flp pilus assembly protein TadD